MKNIKTFEGFFDFFKKKNYEPITIGQILDCLLPITDNEKIKSDLTGNNINGVFTSTETVTKVEDFNTRRTDRGVFFSGKNIFFFRIQYAPVDIITGRYNFNGISDDEVNSIMEECQETLEGFDCQMTFFIGKGSDEGRAWDTEFSDINKMIDKTIKRMDHEYNGVRNITVKIKALGGIEE